MNAASADVGTTEVAQFWAPDGHFDERFGFSMALSGDTAIVGAPREGDLGPIAGAAYIFLRVGTSWIQQAKLLPASGGAGDNIGYCVAIDRDLAVVGAPCDDSAAPGGGAAYVYRRSGSTWSEVDKLTPTDIAGGDHFGSCVGVHGGTVVVGSPQDDDANPGNTSTESGSAYLFMDVGVAWNQVAKLTASDAAPGDIFGCAAAIHGTTVVVAAENDNNSAGAAYIFEAGGPTWSEVAKIAAPSPTAGNCFGRSVSIYRDTVVVGEPLGLQAHVFARNAGAWAHDAVLSDPAGTIGEFGWSVSVHERSVVVGAPLDNVLAFDAGAAFSFVEVGGAWQLETSLRASDGQLFDLLGFSVAVNGNVVLAGVVGDNAQAPMAGAVYEFGSGVGQPYCVGKTNSLGCIPFMSTLGTPKAAGSSAFWLEGNECVPSEAGLLLYSFSKSNLNFHGAKLCVKAPFFRVLPVKVAKNSGMSPCSGVLRKNFGSQIQNGGMPALTAGQIVFAQWRQRDPGDPSGFSDSLTNAVRFEICP